MDFRVLSQADITEHIEKNFGQKLSGFDLSRENVLFHITSGSQFSKIVEKCGVAIFNKPCLTGDYYVNEVIRAKLLPAIVAANAAAGSANTAGNSGAAVAAVNTYAMFYKTIIENYGVSQLTKCANDRKETSMHLLRKAIEDNVGGDTWGAKLEELYKLGVNKIPKKMIANLVDVDGMDVCGVIAPTPQVVVTPPAPAQVVAVPPVPESPRSTVMPLSLPPEVPVVPMIIPETPRAEVTQNPFSSREETPRGNNIVIVKGYEYHFLPSSLRSHLKTIRK